MTRPFVLVAARLGVGAARRILAWPAATRVHDVTTGLPHADGSVDAIFTSHMLEHLDPHDGFELLRECHRALRPGGILRVVVPDLEVIARAYVERDRMFFQSFEGTLAEAFVSSLYLRPMTRGSRCARILRGILRADDGGHRWLHDEESLLHYVRAAGFTSVTRVAFREGADPEVAALDERTPFHIHLEARR